MEESRNSSLFRLVKSETVDLLNQELTKVHLLIAGSGPNVFIQSENGCNEAPITANALSKDANQDHRISQSEQLL